MCLKAQILGYLDAYLIYRMLVHTSMDIIVQYTDLNNSSALQCFFLNSEAVSIIHCVLTSLGMSVRQSVRRYGLAFWGLD